MIDFEFDFECDFAFEFDFEFEFDLIWFNLIYLLGSWFDCSFDDSIWMWTGRSRRKQLSSKKETKQKQTKQIKKKQIF